MKNKRKQFAEEQNRNIPQNQKDQLDQLRRKHEAIPGIPCSTLYQLKDQAENPPDNEPELTESDHYKNKYEKENEEPRSQLRDAQEALKILEKAITILED